MELEMAKSLMIKTLIAYNAFLKAQKESKTCIDAANFLENALKGKKEHVRPGVRITISSVMNAGFNGFQIGGYDDKGKYQIGFFK